MTKKQEHKHCKPEQLYLKMLEIGSECISCGTNLTKIKFELSNCGLISIYEDDTTLKIIFQNSFTHDETNRYYGNYCKAPEPEFECNPKNKEEYERLQKAHDDLEHEYECTWFLTPKAMMNLLHLRESENNRVVSDNSKTISNRSLWVSGVSLFIAILSAFVPLIYDKCYESTDTKQLKELNKIVSQGLIKQETLQYQTSRLIDSIHITLNKTSLLKDSLLKASSKESTKKVLKPVK